ncbi:MAG: caspase family protein [Chloroflexota bacterium]
MLLIGINAYLPNRLPDGRSYRHLGGCVHDIELMEALLKRQLNLPDSQIIKLTSTLGEEGRPIEPPERLPTYANIIAAFKGLTDRCTPGNVVYIHYSGHGGRAITHYPAIKPNGEDEGLVPVDIGTADYIRDVELAYLFKSLVDYGLVVFVVLDCCNSGGAFRGKEEGEEISARGIGVLDTTERPALSTVAVPEALITTWQPLEAANQAARRGLEGVLLGLPEPKGYTLLAACRPHESAFEKPFDNDQKNGVLTHYTCESLNALGFNVTYRQLYNRVFGNIRTGWGQQTPMLFGEADRVLFGVKAADVRYGINVLSYDAANQIVILNTGLALGVNPGAQFAIYPADVADFENAPVVVQVEVIAAEAAESRARLLAASHAPIQPGMQALLTKLADSPFISRVRFLANDPVQPVDQTGAFAKVRAAWEDMSSPYTRLVEDGSADFYVSLEADSAFHILNQLHKPVGNIPAVFSVDDPETYARLARALVHLGKFNYVLKLSNPVPDPALRGNLQVALLNADQQPVRELGIDEKATLIIRNTSALHLSVTILALNADWSIDQLMKIEGDFISIDPQFERSFDIYGSAPQNGQPSRDILKIFATRVSASLQSFELPALVESLDAARLGDKPSDKVNVSDWITEQIEVISR